MLSLRHVLLGASTMPFLFVYVASFMLGGEVAALADQPYRIKGLQLGSRLYGLADQGLRV